MLNLIIALVMGGIIGWVASMVMNRDASMGIVANVIVGCVGSILGRFLLGRFIGGDWRCIKFGCELRFRLLGRQRRNTDSVLVNVFQR